MSKYKNTKAKRIVNGAIVTFDSKKEADRYDQLIILARAGKIESLKLQPKYLLLDTLRIQGHRTMPKRYYIADFEYMQNGKVIVEDVKGMKTPVYKLKKHLFLSIYGKNLTFLET